MLRGRDRSADIATDTNWMAEGLAFDSRQRDISLLHSVQTGSEAHPDSYPWAPEALSPKIEQQRRESDNSFLSSSEIKNRWTYISPPSRLHGVALN
jgi:hypothetical protein